MTYAFDYTPSMPVPFIDLRRFEPGFLDRWAETCRHLTENTRFVGPPETRELEQAMVDRLAVGHAVGCANGTDALQLGLRALGVGPGDTVLLPDATFWATFEAVINCGARPVTVDIDPRDLQMDFELFQRAVDEHKPKAAILVHLYGWGSSRLDDFRRLCRDRSIALLEDAAQAFGSLWQGHPMLQGAQIATLSFYPAKVLGACGDAGLVVCADEALATTVRQLANHGRTHHYHHGLVGWNSRLGGFEAAYLLQSLDHIDDRLASRQRAAEIYRQRLTELGVTCMAPPEGYVENGYLNVTLHDPEKRPAIEAVLKERGIGFGNVYPQSVSRQPGAEGSLAGRFGGEEADRLARGVLNLPLFAYITDAEIDSVIDAMAHAVRAAD